MTSDRTRMTLAFGRVLVRDGREALRVGVRPQTAWTRPPLSMRVDGTQVRVRPTRMYDSGGPTTWLAQRRAAGRGTLVPWAITCDDRPVGDLTIHLDPGTATADIVTHLHRDTPAVPGRAALMRAALSAALTWLAGHADSATLITVRVPLDASGSLSASGPDADTMSGLGLSLVATFPGEADGPWAGEQHWQPAGAPPPNG